MMSDNNGEAEDETVYYWDEDSQAYYYWDEATESYYMYEEPAAEAAEEAAEDCAAEEAADADGANGGDTEVDQQTDLSAFTRGAARRLTYRDHGGLAGCVSTAVAERGRRRASLLTSEEDIKKEARLQLARDLAARAADTSSTAAATGAGPDEAAAGEASTSVRRRSSTVRFGTQEFQDPVFQQRLEAMMGKNLRAA